MSNVMKRALALTIVLLMLFTAVACAGEDTVTPDTGTEDTTAPSGNDKPDDNQTPGNGGGGETPTPEPEPTPEPDFALVEDGKAQFVVISRKNEYDALAVAMATQLTNGAGVAFESKDKKNTGDKAIFIGETPKNLLVDDLDALTYNGYVIRFVNGDIHLTAHSQKGLEDGIAAMVAAITDDRVEVEDGKIKKIMMPGSLLAIHNPTYATPDATLLGRPLSDFEILLPKNYSINERIAVEKLVDQIGSQTGYKLNYIKENAKRNKPCAIVFGKTAHEYTATLYESLGSQSYRIKNNGSDLYVAYANYLVGTEVADGVAPLCVKNSAKTVDTTKSFDYSSTRVEKNFEQIASLGMDAKKVVRIMTSNIVAPGDENGQKDIEEKYGVSWQERMRIQGDMIMTYQPDFVGFQELQEGNTNGVRALAQTEILKTIGSEYTMIYFDGVVKQNYYTPIAYRTDKWTVEEKNASDALSSNSMHRWQWARFRMIDDPATTEDESQIQYIIMNLHYPISSMEDAREAAGKAVHDEYQRLKALYPDIPISITGDFNASFGSDLFNLTIGADEMGVADTPLKPSYMATADIGQGTADIDHVLVENDAVTVLNYRRVTTGLIAWTSDHRPVFADVHIGKVNIPTPGPDMPWGDGQQTQP